MTLKPLRILLRADGTTQQFDAPVPMAQIDELIGAQITDTVTLRRMHPLLHVMVVDDKGWETEVVERESGKGYKHIEMVCLRPLRPINQLATELYLRECVPGTTHQIAGDVYVCPDSDFA